MRVESLSAIEEDLHLLEVGLRQLKVQYDMFFIGALKRQPVELRSRLDKVVKRYTDRPMRNYAQRFRFNALAGKYNSFVERWNKAVRQLEEGDRRQTDQLEQFHIRERLLARVKVGDRADESGMRRLHEQYVEAQKRHGAVKTPSYESFVRGLEDKTRRLRDRAGCAEIEVRVVVRDDKVQLKARPAR